MKKAAVFGRITNGLPDISKRYFEHLDRAGICGVPIYPENPEKAAELYDCLIVCGGGDMHPKYYGQSPYNDKSIYDSIADSYELEIIRAFIKKEKAILGICRGMQSVNVALGGSLIQDIPTYLNLCHQSATGSECLHEIKISERSGLSEIMGIRSIVNSHHHQCVHDLGERLSVIAASHDGVIEAIEGTDIPILAVQWHPERMNGNNVFDYFSKAYL